MADYYQDSLNFLLRPQGGMPEVDSRAAEAAIASGVPVGSAFAANNRLRLRDSEMIQRLALGQQLLQPYLQRQSAQSMQSQALAAEAARQAASDAAAYQRLITSEGGATTRAQLGESGALQRALLSEGGATARSKAEIDARLRETALQLAQRREEAYLPFAQQQYFARLSRIPFSPSNPRPTVWPATYAPVTSSGTVGEAARPKSSGATLAMVDRILSQYGLPTGGTTTTTTRSDPFANWAAQYGTPTREFNWTAPTSPDVRAAQDYYQGDESGAFNWNAATPADVQAMQDYYG